jgi:hypothetical protein
VLVITGAKPQPVDVASRPWTAELGLAALVAFCQLRRARRQARPQPPPQKSPAESQLARFRGTAALTSATARGRLPQRHRDHDSLANTFSRRRRRAVSVLRIAQEHVAGHIRKKFTQDT